MDPLQAKASDEVRFKNVLWICDAVQREISKSARNPVVWLLLIAFAGWIPLLVLVWQAVDRQ